MSTSTQVSIETLDAIMGAFNSHDLDAIMSFFAEDSSWDASSGPDPWGKHIAGKVAIREALAAAFAQLPDAHYALERHWIQDRLAVSEWTLTGTTTDGRKLKMRGCDLWEFKNQKIVRKDSFRKSVSVPA
jgi:ketosteroid isomerase-like protein